MTDDRGRILRKFLLRFPFFKMGRKVCADKKVKKDQEKCKKGVDKEEKKWYNTKAARGKPLGGEQIIEN